MNLVKTFDPYMYDVVVVGAGLTGIIFARHFANQEKRVLVIERREHIAGNMYDFVNEKGIRVQKYGPHSFHTSNEEVNQFIQQYTETEEYILKCSVYMHGKFTPSPFNFKTIDQYFDKEKAKLIKNSLLNAYPNKKQVTIVELLNHENPVISEYAKFLFESDYSLYTAKQWGVKPSDIDPKVLKRVPVLLNYDEQYFYDKYQYVPKEGFTQFALNILDSGFIDVVLDTDFFNYFSIKNFAVHFKESVFNKKVIYTGPLDQLFGYCFGKLPYRSLRFDFKTLNQISYQEAAVTAYPEEPSFTRITEFTKMPFQKSDFTTIAIEYPLQSTQYDEPYYPILTEQSLKVAQKYKVLAKRIPNLIICGRLGEFEYLNMDQAIFRVLKVIGKTQ